ncbi:hypothetical protein BaRGS_00007436 [Batillaria attramentaria]|uniref:Glycoside hydrolase family 38 central domain-containing protein n=1 Tax=Batillaria attramentaria TaxID=370345 RepID=A0ABD0LPB1_9CAEN
MRFSLRKAVLWVTGLVAVQLGLYVWFSLSTRARINHSPRLIELRRQLYADDTCHRQNCPGVKDGMVNVHLIPHSHDDVGWLKTPEQYYTEGGLVVFGIPGNQCVRCVLNTTIAELLKNPERRFIFIEMAFFARWWREIDDGTRQVVARLVKERRLEIVNGGWVMSDAAVTYYNDIIDQHTLGFDFLRDILGTCAQSRVAWHVDQFGHSREHAAIFAQMGFDALFVGRIDFQDHKQRQASKTLEFVWDTSANDINEKGNLFTHVTYDGYYAPKGFVLDGVKNLFGGSGFPEKNILDNFLSQVTMRASKFRTQHLLMPMGSDFGYRVASDWFNNMDKLIKLINVKQNSGSKVNLLYSTPSCYIQHVNHANLSWTVKRDDFHPYAISPGHYWTGYFTSRAGQKLLTKRAGSVLQACKQLGIFARLQDAYNRTNDLRKAVAVMQHHDAITGTEKQHVSNDYNLMLSTGIDSCQDVIEEAYNVLLKGSGVDAGFPGKLEMVYCPDLNISQCAVTENSNNFLVTVYNPLSRPVPTWLRLPVTQHDVQVEDSNGQRVPSQLLPVPHAIQTLPQRSSESDIELAFRATLPPLGYTSFLYLKVTFDGATGRLKEVHNLATDRSVLLSQDFAYYMASDSSSRSSGAYVFVPERHVPTRVGGKDPVSVRLQQDAVKERCLGRLSKDAVKERCRRTLFRNVRCQRTLSKDAVKGRCQRTLSRNERCQRPLSKNAVKERCQRTLSKDAVKERCLGTSDVKGRCQRTLSKNAVKGRCLGTSDVKERCRRTLFRNVRCQRTLSKNAVKGRRQRTLSRKAVEERLGTSAVKERCQRRLSKDAVKESCRRTPRNERCQRTLSKNAVKGRCQGKLSKNAV